MWSTRQMVSRGDDRELFQRSTVRELVVYCCFLLVLIAITFGTTSSVMFYYTQVMGGLFARAKDVDSVEAFWEVGSTRCVRSNLGSNPYSSYCWPHAGYIAYITLCMGKSGKRMATPGGNSGCKPFPL